MTKTSGTASAEGRAGAKSADAFRTIGEVSEVLDTPAHVLRFWETRFTQVKPVKRAGGRRYYRPADVALLAGIRRLLHEQGMTIRGVQKILREQGARSVALPVDEIGGAMPAAAADGLLMESEAFDASALDASEAGEWAGEMAGEVPEAPFIEVAEAPGDGPAELHVLRGPVEPAAPPSTPPALDAPAATVHEPAEATEQDGEAMQGEDLAEAPEEMTATSGRLASDDGGADDSAAGDSAAETGATDDAAKPPRMSRAERAAARAARAARRAAATAEPETPDLFSMLDRPATSPEPADHAFDGPAEPGVAHLLRIAERARLAGRQDELRAIRDRLQALRTRRQPGSGQPPR